MYAHLARSPEAAAAKVYALTGLILKGDSYESIAAKYFALTGRVLR